MSESTQERRVRDAYEKARSALLGSMSPEGFWPGRLSSSALSTATAVSALATVSRRRFGALVDNGVAWLARTQNEDGGWGDTSDSPSNLSTALLCMAAIRIAELAETHSRTLKRAEAYVDRVAGRSTDERVKTLCASYGKDRTFSAPILMNCALADMVEWERVPGLPFELACFPAAMYHRLKLDVVSYALPALIAIGQLIHQRHPTLNPLLRVWRRMAVNSTLKKLVDLQPASGGFLEAVPLTSFVTMSLAAADRRDHPVVQAAVRFLEGIVRTDGSWPIDSDLSVWLTTGSVQALATCGWGGVDTTTIQRWLLARQQKETHPYTQSPPGGWPWTHLPGGVPDADDTAGALLALAALPGEAPIEAVRDGVRWLLDLQNRDGGWPTFCRGWGRLPFDRSAPDLTAHVLRALHAWRGVVDDQRFARAVDRGFKYLRASQRADGAWEPLWFGNQQTPGQVNPVYGSARTLAAFRDLGRTKSPEALQGVRFLVDVQNEDGGWGGGQGAPSTLEETALAVEALAGVADESLTDAVGRGCAFIADAVGDGGLDKASPIGLYFAKLWYSEALYPVVWTVAALGRVLAGPDVGQERPSAVREAAAHLGGA